MPTDPNPNTQTANLRRLRPLAALCVLGASLALAACGSSANGSSSSSTTSSTTSSASSGKAGGPRAGQFAALRTCLQKQGITLPSPPSGGTPQPGAPGFGTGPRRLQPPAGVSQEQFQSALKKCGGAKFGRRGAGLNNPTARAALARYAACLRQS